MYRRVIIVLFASFLTIILKPALAENNSNLHYNKDYDDYYSEDIGIQLERWNRFPITIYLKEVPSKYTKEVISAVNKWNKYISVQILDNPNSDISIEWTNSLKDDIDLNNILADPIGTAQHIYNNGHKCIIKILKQDEYPSTRIEEVVLHELGHALGLGHSNNKNDVMFDTAQSQEEVIIPVVNIQNSAVVDFQFISEKEGRLSITPRDANTLYKVYSATNEKKPVSVISSNIYDINYTEINAQPVWQKYFEDGYTFYSQRRFDLAIESFNKVIRLNPNNADAYTILGDIYNVKGIYNLALSNLNKALSINPANLNAYNSLANVYYNTGKYNLAIDCYKKSIEINPNDEKIFNNLAITYSLVGQINMALDNYKKAITINPNNDNVYCNIGNLYNNIGNYTLAINYYNKAVAINSGNATAYCNTGNAYLNLRQDALAIENFKKALKINPNMNIAKSSLDKIYRTKEILSRNKQISPKTK